MKNILCIIPLLICVSMSACQSPGVITYEQREDGWYYPKGGMTLTDALQCFKPNQKIVIYVDGKIAPFPPREKINNYKLVCFIPTEDQKQLKAISIASIQKTKKEVINESEFNLQGK